MSAISYLQLDKNFDPIWDPAAALIDLDAVAQAIRTRLLLFEGEWWEDLNEGTPMFQEILGQRATVNGQQIMSQALIARVSGTPYVSGVENASTTFSDKTRQLNFAATAQTSFGKVTVNAVPALSAVIT